jgi:hypothetical protein
VKAVTWLVPFLGCEIASISLYITARVQSTNA